MSKLKTWFILFLIVIVGALLRFYHNTDISLWHDEAFSALLIKYGWGEMMYRIGLDVHPPMYYIALRLWSYIFSDSLLALRSFSVFFGIGTALAAYSLVKTAFQNNKAAVLSALFIALNPFQIQYATEARMYTFGAFFTVLGAYFLVRALQWQRHKRQDPAAHLRAGIAYYALFALSMAISILTHYYLLFSAAALCFYALAYHVYYYKTQFKEYSLLLLSYVLIILSFIPWLKIFLFQYKQVGAGYWIPPMDLWSIPTTVWQLFLGFGIDINNTNTKILVSIAFIIVLFAGYTFIRKTIQAEKWLIVLGLLAPFAGSILFLVLAKLKGQDSSVYLVRYFLFASSFLSIILAVWLSNIRFKKVSYALVAIYCILNLVAFSNYWKDLDIKTKPGMRGAVELLQSNVGPSDNIYVGSSFEFFNLKYYLAERSPGLLAAIYENQDSLTPQPLNGRCEIDCLFFRLGTRPFLYSGGQRTIENMPHFAGTAILTNHDLVPNFAEGNKPGDTVWLVWTNGFGGSKPEVPSNWEQVDEKGYAEVRPYVGTWVIVTQYKVN